MIDSTEARLEAVFIHKVGNKALGEELTLSAEALTIDSQVTKQYLTDYFLAPFDGIEGFHFNHGEDLSTNGVCLSVSKIFQSSEALKEASIEISEHLYQQSDREDIPGGELSIVLFKGLQLDGATLDAVGIFKSENKNVYLKFEQDGSNGFNVRSESGVNANKLDKGCLIFNTEQDKGYRVCVVEASSRSKSSNLKYWNERFLNIGSAKDDFQSTNKFLSIAKEYVTKELPDDLQASKADKIDLLNRSVNYFKENETFDRSNFENEVFQDKNVIDSFRSFDDEYRSENEIELADNFAISDKAVKKQVRFFRRVLKLDKNFHIYIHGDRKMIEQGTEDDGRKFYKVYFNNEA